MLPLALDPTALVTDPVGALMLLFGAGIVLFTMAAGGYLTVGALGELVTADT